MNPYDFVRVDWSRLPDRRPAPAHDRFTGVSGRIEATLTAETPLFLPGKTGDGRPLTERSGATLFSQSRAYVTDDNPLGFFIPGSSLKGLFRSLTETVAQGCFLFHPSEAAPPPAFRRCTRAESLCPACRLFGLVSGEAHRLGCVGFGDARLTSGKQRAPMFTAILSGPKPRHVAFYRDGEHIAGRKYYFHHRSDNLLTANGWLGKPGRYQNAHIRPLETGAVFRFAAEFTNVAEGDLAALLYALTLEEGLRHKFGYAKPCGLGSVHIQVKRLEVRSPADRYRSGTGQAVFEGSQLAAELAGRTAPVRAALPAVTAESLKRIWRWPVPDGVYYTYPDQRWFREHSQAPLSETP